VFTRFLKADAAASPPLAHPLLFHVSAGFDLITPIRRRAWGEPDTEKGRPRAIRKDSPY